MEIDVLFAGVPITDLAVASRWWETMLGRPPDITVNEIEVMWRIADQGWLYLVVDALRAGKALVAVSVSDLDEVVAEIGRRGIDLDSTETLASAGRKAYFVDPDGNSVAVIEVNPPASD